MGTPAPRNFSWFVEGKLAGMGFPEEEHFAFLVDSGVKTLVNLTQFHYSTEPYDIAVHNICVADFYAPTVEQIKEFLEIVDNAQEVPLPATVQNAILYVSCRRWACIARWEEEGLGACWPAIW